MTVILFQLKKIVSRMFFPIPLVLELLVLGFLFKKWRRPLILTAIVLLYLFSCGPFSYMILRPLEGQYDPVNAVMVNKEIRWIVVLSGGSRDHKTLTPEDCLEAETLKRLLEGMRLSRLLPGAKLILSGGSFKGETSDAVLMQRVAREYGVNQERILLETESWDTADEARLLKARLGKEPFYLVTTASHMPRAVRIFARAGTRPLAAPTDFQAIKIGQLDILDFIPQTASLSRTETAFYEYLGLGWDLFLSNVRSASR